MIVRKYIVWALIFAVTAVVFSDTAMAVDVNLSVDMDGEGLCEDGPGNKDWLFSLGALVVGAVGMTVAGMATVSRSLASSGFRQGSANLASIGLGLLVGGGVGAAVMAARDCGLMTPPGFLGLAVAGIGAVVALFAFATGRR